MSKWANDQKSSLDVHGSIYREEELYALSYMLWTELIKLSSLFGC